MAEGVVCPDAGIPPPDVGSAGGWTADKGAAPLGERGAGNSAGIQPLRQQVDVGKEGICRIKVLIFAAIMI